MSYLGKEFTLERTEKFDEFLASIGIPQEYIDAIMAEKSVETLEKDGDTYTLTTSLKTISFESGVEFDEEVSGKECKITFVVDGDTITQTQTFPAEGFTVTFKKQYSDDELVVEATNSAWDGVAYSYYSA